MLLDPAAPTRLFSSLPDGVTVERVGLVEAIEATRDFLGPQPEPALASASAAV